MSRTRATTESKSSRPTAATSPRSARRRAVRLAGQALDAARGRDRSGREHLCERRALPARPALRRRRPLPGQFRAARQRSRPVPGAQGVAVAAMARSGSRIDLCRRCSGSRRAAATWRRSATRVRRRGVHHPTYLALDCKGSCTLPTSTTTGFSVSAIAARARAGKRSRRIRVERTAAGRDGALDASTLRGKFVIVLSAWRAERNLLAGVDGSHRSSGRRSRSPSARPARR